ncbi:MAG: hypothetical protein AABX54_05350, partial [Nanoarchaeota archaeon]
GLQGKYSSLAQKGKFWELDRLRRQTGVEPQLSDQEISRLYTTSLSEYTVNAVQFVEQTREWDKRAHKGKPVVFEGLDFADYEEAIQDGYHRTIADEWSMERKHFEALKKLTGVAVSEEIVQHAINARIKTGNVLGDYYFKNVQGATGIKPVPDNDVVQGMFRKCLRDKRNGPYFWEYLVKSTGIKPEEKLAQQAYRQFVRQEKTYDLTRFVEFTGIVPEERTVHDAYRILVKRNKFGDSFSEVQKVTGIAPKPQTVQAAYSVIVDRKESIWDSYLKSVFESTGITPSQETIQKAYETCVNQGHLDTFKELYNTFKVQPAKGTKRALDTFFNA